MSDWLSEGDRFFVDEGDAFLYANVDPVLWVSEPPEAALCHIEEVEPNRRWRVTWGDPLYGQDTETHEVSIVPAGFGWRVIERTAPRLRVVRHSA